MRNKFKYLFFIIPLLLIINAGCVKNVTCISSNDKLRIELYNIQSDTIWKPITLDSLTLYFLGHEDSLVYDRKTGVKVIEIPLSDTADRLTIVMKINDGIDIMRLDYRAYFVFRSTECGVINRYEISRDSLRCTGNKVEKLYLENNIVDESEAVNLLMAVDVD